MIDGDLLVMPCKGPFVCSDCTADLHKQLVNNQLFKEIICPVLAKKQMLDQEKVRQISAKKNLAVSSCRPFNYKAKDSLPIKKKIVKQASIKSAIFETNTTVYVQQLVLGLKRKCIKCYAINTSTWRRTQDKVYWLCSSCYQKGRKPRRK
jgi:hypothetical protein